MKIQLTSESEKLFNTLEESAADWNGCICLDEIVYITPELKGNLTHLKRKKLITTFKFDDHAWVRFTDLGKEIAKEHGYDVKHW